MLPKHPKHTTVSLHHFGIVDISKALRHRMKQSQCHFLVFICVAEERCANSSDFMFFLVFGSRRHVRRAKSQSGSGNTPLALAEGWSPPSMLSRSEVTDVMAIFFGDQKIGKDT